MPANPTKTSPGLEQLLSDLIEAAVGKAGASKRPPLLHYMLFAALAALCFAFVGWLAVRAKRRAAELEYKLRVAHEEALRAAERARVEQNAQAREAAQANVARLSADIDELKKGLDEASAAARERAKTLARTTSWDDLVIIDRRTR